MTQAENPHRCGQACGLFLQGVCRRRGFFNQRSILLRHIIHLVYRNTNLLNATALFIRRGGNFLHNIGHTTHSANNAGHGFPGMSHLF
ncbi:hypothetical protein D3C75_878930 [compost metagenome]